MTKQSVWLDLARPYRGLSFPPSLLPIGPSLTHRGGTTSPGPSVLCYGVPYFTTSYLLYFIIAYMNISSSVETNISGNMVYKPERNIHFSEAEEFLFVIFFCSVYEVSK